MRAIFEKIYFIEFNTEGFKPFSKNNIVKIKTKYVGCECDND